MSELEQSMERETEDQGDKKEGGQGRERAKHPLAAGILIGVLVSLFCLCTTLLILMKTERIHVVAGPAARLLSNETVAKIGKLSGLIDSHYYKDDYTREDEADGLYKGLLDSLEDPYSVYYTEEELAAVMEQTEGVYFGIGAYVSYDEAAGYALIGGTFADSPAEAAGLLQGDYIIEVDGQDTKGMTASEVVSLIKGEEGTSFHAKFRRQGEVFEKELVRRKIESPTVEYKMLDRDKSIGYIRIREFDEVTTQQFKDAYADLKAQDMKGLLLDLRSNPGGSVSVVTEIAKVLLPKGLLVYTLDRNEKREEILMEEDGEEIGIPLVVLVNADSASASEILAGAIRDYKKGTLLGKKTYGKGVIQQIIGLGDNTAVKITISSYYTPSGYSIQEEKGIEPDIESEFDTERYLADKKTDSQLEDAQRQIVSMIKE